MKRDTSQPSVKRRRSRRRSWMRSWIATPCTCIRLKTKPVFCASKRVIMRSTAQPRRSAKPYSLRACLPRCHARNISKWSLTHISVVWSVLLTSTCCSTRKQLKWLSRRRCRTTRAWPKWLKSLKMAFLKQKSVKAASVRARSTASKPLSLGFLKRIITT